MDIHQGISPAVGDQNVHHVQQIADGITIATKSKRIMNIKNGQAPTSMAQPCQRQGWHCCQAPYHRQKHKNGSKFSNQYQSAWRTQERTERHRSKFFSFWSKQQKWTFAETTPCACRPCPRAFPRVLIVLCVATSPCLRVRSGHVRTCPCVAPRQKKRYRYSTVFERKRDIYKRKWRYLEEIIEECAQKSCFRRLFRRICQKNTFEDYFWLLSTRQSKLGSLWWQSLKALFG